MISFMWNLRNRTNEWRRNKDRSRNRFLTRENKMMVTREEARWNRGWRSKSALTVRKKKILRRRRPCCELVAGAEAVLLTLSPGGPASLYEKWSQECFLFLSVLNAQNKMKEIHFIKAILWVLSSQIFTSSTTGTLRKSCAVLRPCGICFYFKSRMMRGGGGQCEWNTDWVAWMVLDTSSMVLHRGGFCPLEDMVVSGHIFVVMA